MIVSFGDQATEDLFHGVTSAKVRRFPKEIISGALRKLDLLNAATGLLDLRSPPENHLEALKGDLKGFHSIRVNDPWRVVFRWVGTDAHEVKMIDYH